MQLPPVVKQEEGDDEKVDDDAFVGMVELEAVLVEGAAAAELTVNEFSVESFGL